MSWMSSNGRDHAASAACGPLVGDRKTNDRRDRRLREWLLLLRFGVTREAADRWAVLAMADELDSLGMRWRPAAPSFFVRTSNEICDAILTGHDAHSHAILRRHMARIDDPRLRRAFGAAVDLQQPEQQIFGSVLWRGLRKNHCRT